MTSFQIAVDAAAGTALALLRRRGGATQLGCILIAILAFLLGVVVGWGLDDDCPPSTLERVDATVTPDDRLRLDFASDAGAFTILGYVDRGSGADFLRSTSFGKDSAEFQIEGLHGLIVLSMDSGILIVPREGQGDYSLVEKPCDPPMVCTAPSPPQDVDLIQFFEQSRRWQSLVDLQRCIQQLRPDGKEREED